jgi:hypothetical protein
MSSRLGSAGDTPPTTVVAATRPPTPRLHRRAALLPGAMPRTARECPARARRSSELTSAAACALSNRAPPLAYPGQSALLRQALADNLAAPVGARSRRRRRPAATTPPAAPAPRPPPPRPSLPRLRARRPARRLQQVPGAPRDLLHTHKPSTPTHAPVRSTPGPSAATAVPT